MFGSQGGLYEFPLPQRLVIGMTIFLVSTLSVLFARIYSMIMYNHELNHNREGGRLRQCTNKLSIDAKELQKKKRESRRLLGKNIQHMLSMPS